MYHIKEDKRAKASVELICDGLKRCLKEKSFESVTISDIQRVSGVSRSTFYRTLTAATCCTQACAAARAVCAPDCPNREMRRCWIILRP